MHAQEWRRWRVGGIDTHYNGVPVYGKATHKGYGKATHKAQA
jgi:hypothetical protein